MKPPQARGPVEGDTGLIADAHYPGAVAYLVGAQPGVASLRRPARSPAPTPTPTPSPTPVVTLPPAVPVVFVPPVAAKPVAAPRVPTGAQAGEADTSGQFTAGGAAGLAGLLAFGAAFVLRRRHDVTG